MKCPVLPFLYETAGTASYLRIKKRVPFLGATLSLLLLLTVGGAIFLMGPKNQVAAADGKADPSFSEELQGEGGKSSPEPESVQEETVSGRGRV